jgi:hypothetical protein
MRAVPSRLPGDKPTWVEIAEIIAFMFCFSATGLLLILDLCRWLRFVLGV